MGSEYFDVCDENGNPTGQIVERSIAHRDGIMHRTAHIWVIRNVDGRYQILLQKRSMNKDSFPGRFDTSSAGHIQAGDEVMESAQRELYEELGIEALYEELKLIGNFRIKYEKEFHGKMFKDNEIAHVFVYEKDVDISTLSLQSEEVSEVRWFDFEETYEQCSIKNQMFCVPMGGLDVLRNYLFT